MNTAEFINRLRKRLKNKDFHRRMTRGAALLELALITPFLITTATMSFDLGRMVYVQNRLTVAAYEAAKVVSSSNDVNWNNIQCASDPQGDISKLNPSENTLCAAMMSRAAMVLNDSGVPARSCRINFVVEQKQEGNQLLSFPGIDIRKDYVQLFSLGLRINKLKAKVVTYFGSKKADDK